MKRRIQIDKKLWAFLVGGTIVGVFILGYFNGTGNEADSINHYLHAKYAFKHPALFLNHWAKPFFTLVVSPFAQFGFTAVKAFNLACSLMAAAFVYKIAIKLQIKNAILAAIFYFIFPLSFITTFSGLTEPLSALMLMAAIYLSLCNRFYLAAIVISFTPFVRSEGLIFLGVFAFYFSYLKNWKALLLLFTGHLLYSIIGSFYYGDLLWVFTKIPYANLGSPYGSGPLFHFAEQLIYITGVPLLIFFCLGILQLFLKSKKENNKYKADILLIFLCFLAFFVAHTVFWHFGVFNSMGLKRVLAAVTPVMALLCLLGFNLSTEWIKNALVKMGLQFCLLAYIFIFPFTSNPAAVNWKEDMNLSLSQETAKKVSEYILQNELPYQRIIFADVYLAEAMNFDPFDKEKALIINQLDLNKPSAGDLIVWDNWHAIVDHNIKRETVDSVEGLTKIKDFTFTNNRRTADYGIYLATAKH